MSNNNNNNNNNGMGRARGKARGRAAAREAPTVPGPAHQTLDWRKYEEYVWHFIGSKDDSKFRPPRPVNNPSEFHLRAMFEEDRERTLSLLLDSAPTTCQIDVDVLAEHFRRALSLDDYVLLNKPQSVPRLTWSAGEEVAKLVAEIRREEVVERFTKTSWSKGPDGVSYQDLAEIDPDCKELTAIFNRCLREQQVPSDWKYYITFLKFKKNDAGDVNNWRPLTKSNTILRLYTSVLGARIRQWAKSTRRISLEQKKGSASNEEANFIVQAAIDNARRDSAELCVAWLDISNASASVPHQYLLRVLRMFELPGSLHAVIQDLHNNLVTRVKAANGQTDKIPVERGLKQGCGLSPILFSLCLEPLIRSVTSLVDEHGVNLHGRRVNLVAYDDDIVVMADNVSSLQILLNALSVAADWAGLTFKSPKCASLHVDCRRDAHDALYTRFEVQGVELKRLERAMEYIHLGIPTGFSLSYCPMEVMEKVTRDIHRLNQSALLNDQKIVALSSVLGKLNPFLKGDRFPKESLKRLDLLIKRILIEWKGVASSYRYALLWLPIREGGSGLLPLDSLKDATTVVHGYRLLSSHDADVRAIAWGSLRREVSLRLGREAHNDVLALFLGGGGVYKSCVSSVWTDTRNACGRLSRRRVDCEWRYNEDADQMEVVNRPGNALMYSLKCDLRDGFQDVAARFC